MELFCQVASTDWASLKQARHFEAKQGMLCYLLASERSAVLKRCPDQNRFLLGLTVSRS